MKLTTDDMMQATGEALKLAAQCDRVLINQPKQIVLLALAQVFGRYLATMSPEEERQVSGFHSELVRNATLAYRAVSSRPSGNA